MCWDKGLFFDAEQHVLRCFIFPAFLLLLVFSFLCFPGVYLRLLKKKLLIDQAIPEAIFMLYGQFHEREFLLVIHWREWCFESCGNCLRRRRVQWEISQLIINHEMNTCFCDFLLFFLWEKLADKHLVFVHRRCSKHYSTSLKMLVFSLNWLFNWLTATDYKYQVKYLSSILKVT